MAPGGRGRLRFAVSAVKQVVLDHLSTHGRYALVREKNLVDRGGRQGQGSGDGPRLTDGSLGSALALDANLHSRRTPINGTHHHPAGQDGLELAVVVGLGQDNQVGATLEEALADAFLDRRCELGEDCACEAAVRVVCKYPGTRTLARTFTSL